MGAKVCIAGCPLCSQSIRRVFFGQGWWALLRGLARDLSFRVTGRSNVLDGDSKTTRVCVRACRRCSSGRCDSLRDSLSLLMWASIDSC